MAESTISMRTRAALGTLADAILAAVEVNLYREKVISEVKDLEHKTVRPLRVYKKMTTQLSMITTHNFHIGTKTSAKKILDLKSF